MKALWFEKGKLGLRELRVPIPSRGEALIRVHYAGICNTDLEIFRGYMDFTGVPGHEFAGDVLQGPPGWTGKRVTGEINLYCGKCDFCRQGMTRHCPNRTVLGIAGKNGAFAEYLTLPVANLHEIPKPVSDLEAVFIEPLAAALRILDQVEIKPHQPVYLLGDGKLAQMIARVVRLKTDRLTVVGKHPEKLKLLKGRGVLTVLADKLGNLDPLKKPALVIEATGNESGLRMALEICRPLGTIVLKSTFHGQPQVSLSRLVVDEMQLTGSRCGDFPAAIKCLARKQVSVKELVSGVYRLEEFRKAFDSSTSGPALKVVLQCQ